MEGGSRIEELEAGSRRKGGRRPPPIHLPTGPFPQGPGAATAAAAAAASCAAASIAAAEARAGAAEAEAEALRGQLQNLSAAEAAKADQKLAQVRGHRYTYIRYIYIWIC